MGIPCKTYSASSGVWKCVNCNTHLAGDKEFVSNNFSGETGRAFLFNRGFNMSRQHREAVNMTTGQFVVQYLNCRYCNSYVGWHYCEALSSKEEYKVGKCVLEEQRLERTGLTHNMHAGELEFCDDEYLFQYSY